MKLVNINGLIWDVDASANVVYGNFKGTSCPRNIRTGEIEISTGPSWKHTWKAIQPSRAVWGTEWHSNGATTSGNYGSETNPIRITNWSGATTRVIIGGSGTTDQNISDGFRVVSAFWDFSKSTITEGLEMSWSKTHIDVEPSDVTVKNGNDMLVFTKNWTNNEQDGKVVYHARLIQQFNKEDLHTPPIDVWIEFINP